MRPIACRPRGFSAYKYLLNGIREFPTAEALAAEIADHGFQEVSYESYHGRCRYTTLPVSLSGMSPIPLAK